MWVRKRIRSVRLLFNYIQNGNTYGKSAQKKNVFNFYLQILLEIYLAYIRSERHVGSSYLV
jgi:hypothetical protein